YSATVDFRSIAHQKLLLYLYINIDIQLAIPHPCKSNCSTVARSKRNSTQVQICTDVSRYSATVTFLYYLSVVLLLTLSFISDYK
ncbi:MAG: hypothetical protein Q4E48_05660, partial [Prevotella sp.]|nr:hypothetical protein [Prevotella sp.]